MLSVVGRYTDALALLDDYDHRRIAKPAGRKGRSRLTYGECRRWRNGRVILVDVLMKPGV